MLVQLSTVLDVDAMKAWKEVQNPDLLEYVARPLIHFRFLNGRPERWEPGQYPVEMSLFGVIPMGGQTVGLEFPPSEGDEYRLRDNGHGSLARTWDHLVIIEPVGPGLTRYTDRLRVNAGVLTAFVGAFAWVFYWHRQRRWRRLVSSGFDYGK